MLSRLASAVRRAHRHAQDVAKRSMATTLQQNVTTELPKERFFNDPQGMYLLPADSAEGRRLNEQHYKLRFASGGKLVHAPVELQDGDRVLDCGTGTGVWALDLASQLPTSRVSFTCVDISPHLFPAKPPADISFAQHSVLALPESFDGAFALTHMRLLVLALRRDEWPIALRELFRATRPGGWTQLCEIHCAGVTACGPATAHVMEVQTELMRLRGLDMDAGLHLREWAREAGFVNVQEMRLDVLQKQEGLADSQVYTVAYTAMKTAAHSCGLVNSEEEWESTVYAMRDELDRTPNATWPFYFVWAQRPLE